MPKLGMHPGATWRKVDFQIHTPRDPQWRGSPQLAGGAPDLEDARKAWAKTFVEECIKRGLQAIAITDHHDFCLLPYVQEAIKALEEEANKPWLFPGVEVTCNDAVQCLVLFDQDSTPEVWNRLFGGHLSNVQATDANLASCAQAVLCGKEIKEFFEGVSKDSALADRSIVLPHASNEGAHKSMLRAGFHTRFKELPFDGVYTDKSFPQLDDSTKNKIYGTIEQWGNRRRGIIPTGDNRNANYEKLGAHECWIRLGEPTVESIRQAVLADEARIAYSAPSLPPQRIELIEIDSSLTGPDFKISFNDGFTALIGGRGSGKTAVLEYLRYGLGRSSVDISGEPAEVRSREYGLVNETLGAGGVRVTLMRDGVREVWSRTPKSGDLITVRIEDGTEEKISIAEAQKRFRARGFYQKQLSTIVADPSKAAEQITGIAAAEFIDRRQMSDEAIAGAKRDVQSAFQKLVEYWITHAGYDRDKAAVADIKRRMDAVKKLLGESGLTQENQALLNDAPVYDLASALIIEAAEAIDKDKAILEKLRKSIPSADVEQLAKASGFPEVVEFTAAVADVKAELDTAVASAQAAMGNLSSAHKALTTKFEARRQEFLSKHVNALKQQESLGALVAELQKLTASLQAAETTERKSQMRLKSVESAPNDLAEARDRLAEAVEARRKLLVDVAGQVQGMSEGVLEAGVETEKQPSQYVDALTQVCESSRIREARCEEIAKSSQTADGAPWHHLTNAILDVYCYKVQTQAPNPDQADLVKERLQSVFGTLTSTQIATIYSRMEISEPAAMLTSSADSYVVFRYKDAKGEIPFEVASPGQQAAALLHLLLYQQAGSLIIDQPEDDLDNKTVMKIIRLLQSTKKNRQLIFATHNPNFVVNGDADKVIALIPTVGNLRTDQQARIAIEVDGAIETDGVRRSITDTMEGGRAAFELRGRKYQFGV